MPPRVLVVEDYARAAELLARQLQVNGIETRIASDWLKILRLDF